MLALLLLLVGCHSWERCELETEENVNPEDAQEEYDECLYDAGEAACERGDGPELPEGLEDYAPYCDGWCDAGCWAEDDTSSDCACD